MQRILVNAALTSEAIAEAIEVVVSNISNPTELHALGTADPDWAMTHEVNGGAVEPATLYRLQPESGPESMPYVVSSATAGLYWVAIAGIYSAVGLFTNNSISGVNISASGAIFADGLITSRTQVLSQTLAAAGIQLDPNAATGNFILSLSPANLTANRRWTFPDSSGVIAGSAAALTPGRVPFVGAGGVLTDSAALTYSATVLNIANTTAATATTNGSLTIGNGTAATNVGIGGGAIWAGGAIISKSSLNVFLNGSDTILNGPYLAIGNAAVTKFWSSQLSASNHLDTWWYDTGVSTLWSRFNNVGTQVWYGTTAASSAVTGTVVVGGGVSAATNVGIGGGVVWAGTRVIAAAAASNTSALFVKNNGADDFISGICMQRQSTLDTWSFLVGGDNNYYFGYATNASGANAASDFASIARFSTSGQLSVYGTTAASSSITGTVIVGDGATAATNVGIGGGSIYAGGNNSTFGNATGANVNKFRVLVDATSAALPQHIEVLIPQTVGNASAIGWGYNSGGANAGTIAGITASSTAGIAFPNIVGKLAFAVQNSGATVSALTVTPTVISALLTTAASSSITGGLVIGDGATAATNVGIGGGLVYAGTKVVVKASGGNDALRMDTTGASAQIGMTWADNALDKWIFYKNTVHVLAMYDAVNTRDQLTFIPGTATTAIVRVTATTAASSSITGSLQVGDGSTAATSVGIGGGNVNAGGTLTVAGASGLERVSSSGTVAGDYIYKISNASATGLGLRVQPGADGNDAIAVRNAAGSTITFSVSGGGTVAAAGSILTTSSATGIGYATGAGGTVTQATSKATTVTLNKMCGQITMNNAALAAGAKVTFSCNNTGLAASDGAVCWVQSGGTANAYRVSLTSVGSGTMAFTVENITAGSLSESPVISFAVIKSVAS